MTPESVMTLGRQAIETAILVSAPLLLASLIVGLVVSIFQAATQINEQTLTFIPKLLATFCVLAFAGPWLLRVLTDYIRRLIESIPFMIG